MKMIEVITRAPLYVWPLLAYLIYVGIRSRKTRWISMNLLAVCPVAFLSWSYYSRAFPIAVWLLCIAAGVGLGLLMVRNLPIRFDKKKRLAEIPGNWVTLGMSLSIFVIRYYLGVIYALFPDMIGSWPLMTLEVTAVVISGIFLGRLIGYWQKYSNSEHILLD